MPRERIYTDSGYVEVQWSRGGLICLVSSDGETETMHQFTSAEDVKPVLSALRRAGRQAFDVGVRVECGGVKFNLASGSAGSVTQQDGGGVHLKGVTLAPWTD